MAKAANAQARMHGQSDAKEKKKNKDKKHKTGEAEVLVTWNPSFKESLLLYS